MRLVLRAGPNGKDVTTRCTECGTNTYKCTYTPTIAGTYTTCSSHVGLNSCYKSGGPAKLSVRMVKRE